MPSKELVTTEIKNRALQTSKRTEGAETLVSASTIFSETLTEELSHHVSLTANYAQRLQNLIHSEVEQLEEDYLQSNEKTRKLSYETVLNIKTLGTEFRETVKLGIDLTKTKMELERGK